MMLAITFKAGHKCIEVNRMTTSHFKPSARKFKSSIFHHWKESLALGMFCTLASAIPVRAAEKLYLTYGPLQLSVSVASLETFAKEGKINKDLEFFLGQATPEQQAQFREALVERANLDPLVVSRFFNTEIGEAILTRIGKFITIERGSNGKYALRGAIVQAALDPQGLTLLNFLQKLPTNMQFQGELMLKGSKAAEIAIQATEVSIEEMKKLTAMEAKAEPPVDFSTLPDLRKPGEYAVEKETWLLADESRKRTFYIDVYKPQRWREGKTPVVIISHGLASRPEDFAKDAEHLSSYGYVVALPQHPGSDTKQAKALIEGYAREVFDVDEFINRPKDISYVIDELERRNQSQFEGRLALDSVGVGGHSFGGYTALAVAGAEIDFENLEQECNRQFSGLNISLLLQCRALALPRQAYNFRDERVQAVYAINPVNSSIFGPKGLSKIEIPVSIGAGTYDPATPLVFEQVRSFLWLTTPNKYLAAVEGQAHVDFSQLDAEITEAIASVENLTLPTPQLIANYTHSMQLAFFEVYISARNDIRPYLQSSYAEYLCREEPFKFYLLGATSSQKFAEAMAKFKREH
jgi:predicted dienelactone hydrolase